jgi:hypothetical protein
MQILNRARGAELELVSNTESDNNVKEEANRRAAKAGYCTREGNPTFGMKIMGPGIGISKLNQWPRDENGNLIGD